MLDLRMTAGRRVPRSVLLLAIIALLAVGGQQAAAAPRPTPHPASRAPITTPGGLRPGQRPAAPAYGDGVHIVKDTSGPSCSGYSSQTIPPSSIRVLVHGNPDRVVTVPFEQYVENVLPNEWVASWDSEALKAGAVATKSYAWFWVNHYGGYYQSPSDCFDVTDDTNFQVYAANSALPQTDAAVEQTWNVVARENQQVLQAAYQAYLSSPGEGCGTQSDGTVLSQYGTQACAQAGESYQTMLTTYYYPGLELAGTTTGPGTAPAAGPLVQAGSGALCAYRVASSRVAGTCQAGPGRAFGPESLLAGGTGATGLAAALKAADGTLVVYVRTSGGQLLGNGQPRPGSAFSGWRLIGASSPVLVSDPTPLLTSSGALEVIGTASDGNVWATGQYRVGSAFGRWVRLSTGGGFLGRPAALVTAAGTIGVYARHGYQIEGAGQYSVGGTFSAFGVVGSATPALTGDPGVLQTGDGLIVLFATGGGAWSTSQQVPGGSFGPWREVAASSSAADAPAAHAFGSGSVVLYVRTSSGTVAGTQAAGPAGGFAPLRNLGAGSPGATRRPSLVFGANGAMTLGVLGAGGYLWQSSQPVPGSAFGAWNRIGA
ncbi:MAG: SpoIID/LytB domain-containing protein [Jatrophihabitantaceae bacterium]